MDYLDTSYVIALAVKNDANHDAALDLERLVEDPVVSRLVVAEAYAYYSRKLAGRTGQAGELVEAMVEYSIKRCGARLVEVDFNHVVGLVGDYAPRVPLKTLDLLHLLAAREAGASRIVTLDKDIWRKRVEVEEWLGLQVLGVERGEAAGGAGRRGSIV